MRISISEIYVEPRVTFCIPHQILNLICRALSKALENEQAFVTKYKADYNLVILITTRQRTQQTDIRRPAILRKHQCVEYVVYLPYKEITESTHYLLSLSTHLLSAIKEILSKYKIGSASLDQTFSQLIKKLQRAKTSKDF